MIGKHGIGDRHHTGIGDRNHWNAQYWVAAREVRLRAANLPKGLLDALRDRNTDLIVLAVCHLLFINRLRQESEGSADATVHEVFPTWIEFIERHPVARSLAPTQMGLCGDSPPCIQPLGPGYLPAEPLDKIESGPRARTAWYAADPHALLQSFASFRAVQRTPGFRPTVTD